MNTIIDEDTRIAVVERFFETYDEVKDTFFPSWDQDEWDFPNFLDEPFPPDSGRCGIINFDEKTYCVRRAPLVFLGQEDLKVLQISWIACAVAGCCHGKKWRRVMKAAAATASRIGEESLCKKLRREASSSQHQAWTPSLDKVHDFISRCVMCDDRERTLEEILWDAKRIIATSPEEFLRRHPACYQFYFDIRREKAERIEQARLLPRNDPELRAYHEAGHTLAAYLLKKVQNGTISIGSGIPTPAGFGSFQRAGRDTNEHLMNLARSFRHLSPRTLKMAEKDVLIALSGHAAEHTLLRGKHLECVPDIDQALTFAEMCCGNSEKASAYVRSVWEEALYLFIIPRYWAAVVAMANELLKSKVLDGERAFKIIEEALVGFAEAA